jgi:hypothetical protein
MHLTPTIGPILQSTTSYANLRNHQSQQDAHPSTRHDDDLPFVGNETLYAVDPFCADFWIQTNRFGVRFVKLNRPEMTDLERVVSRMR